MITDLDSMLGTVEVICDILKESEGLFEGLESQVNKEISHCYHVIEYVDMSDYDKLVVFAKLKEMLLKRRNLKDNRRVVQSLGPLAEELKARTKNVRTNTRKDNNRYMRESFESFDNIMMEYYSKSKEGEL